MAKFRYYPLKPETEDGFKKAVAWFGGRELIASLKGLIIYTIYGENIDPRNWMKPNIFPEMEDKLNSQLFLKTNVENVEAKKSEVESKINEYWANKSFQQWEWKKNHFSYWEDYLENEDFWKKLNADEKTQDEFWFDYISDTGDGQMGVYSVACLCLADLWLDEEKIDSAVRFKTPEKADVDKKTLLPRGSYLFIGGDTAYHSADYTTLFERFQSPFRWAFFSVRKFMWENYGLKTSPDKNFQFATQEQAIENIINENGEFHKNWDGTFVETENESPKLWDTEPTRPLFGIPANHDYYDAIAGFNKQFRRPPFKDIQENSADNRFWGNVPLKIHTFSREQEASYVAINLPFKWWMFGIDSEHSQLDNRQKIFFHEIVNKWMPRKLILATPEPTTVFGIKTTKADKTAKYLTEITRMLGYQQPFLNDGKFLKIDEDKNIIQDSTKGVVDEKQCRLDLSGDVHHYARYWGPIVKGTLSEDFDDKEYSTQNYASLVAGGGGAFFDSTETLVGEEKVITKDGKIIDVEGDVPPLAIFPGKKESITHTADKIFDLWNIKKGGYVQIGGGIMAIIIFFCLTKVSNLSNDFTKKGLSSIFGLLGNPFALSNDIERKGFMIGVMLLGMVGLLAMSAILIRQLVEKLEMTDQTPVELEVGDGRIRELAWRFLPALAALMLYLGFFLPWKTLIVPNNVENSYHKSWFLLYHFIFAGLMGWLALIYSKWLDIRMEYSRGFKNPTLLQIMQDPLTIGRNPLQRYLGRISREYTLQYIPETILFVLAVMSVVFGIAIFGKGILYKTAADLLFIMTFFGGFILIAIVLGYSVGGSYQKTSGKVVFLLLGIFHAILQLLTPFVLVFYGNWIFVIAFFIIAFIFNGFSRVRYRLSTLLKENYKQNGWRSYIWRWSNFQLAGYIMKKDKPWLFATVWIVFGLFTLLTPWIISSYYSEKFQTVNSFVVNYVDKKVKVLLIPITQYIPHDIIEWLPILVVMIIIGFIGYRTSRIWFSWYLGVSLGFNGHNNEVGGLARIEDFKHILRIRVKEDKLTVFVIGIDEAKPDLTELEQEKTDRHGNTTPNIRLVDKFDLKYQ